MRSQTLLPFAVIEEEFRGLDRPPNALHVECSEISGALPGGSLSPTKLREVLLHPSTAYETRDAALGWLVRRAQTDGDRWMLAVIGMILPGLRARTGYLTKRCPSRVMELQTEIVEAVIEAVHGLPPGRRRIAASLVWSGFRGGHDFVAGHLTDSTRCESSDGATPEVPEGHPDLVLSRAVAEGVIDEVDAAIIGETRIGRTRATRLPIPENQSYRILLRRRRKAERRLVAWLGEQVA